ncbi:Gfo/Idh/MocA family protein [Roseobacter sinensis]|uniref:Gfo/Idh/MocA family oxidoreductase n=1 Tax=Roseobacter sinensis TaxID=2931391 RepID=A0ABT3BJM0_9RHOB|nr:Gfo/Idh/MocA family oxidoreductase [Roseobacter sp. WL0113]MCV3273775.1 Gfo/Idh/MocA family oxidoreductase [Roseobacter sp. WL0113]
MTHPSGRSFRWAILGTGSVARKFARDLQAMGSAVTLQTVASRSLENARRFAAEFGAVEGACDYETAARSECDALYIATPAALHEPHARLGIAAGKPVLVEKPLAPDAASARRIAAAAAEAGVFCMEAMWTRFQPLPTRVRDELAAGLLGELRGFDGQFMIANRPEPGVSLFDPDQAGGALLHRGIYPVSLAHFFLGPVAEVQAFGRLGETGVDEDSVVLLRHASGALSTLRASLRSNGRPGTRIYGTTGTLELEGPVWRPTRARLYRTTPGSAAPGAPRRLEALRESRMGLRLSGALGQLKRLAGRSVTTLHAPFEGNGYRHEAQALMQAVAAGETVEPRMTPQDSIAVLEIIDAAAADWTKGPRA